MTPPAYYNGSGQSYTNTNTNTNLTDRTSSSRDACNYSSLDDEEFICAWSQFQVVDASVEDTEEETVTENYFETGIQIGSPRIKDESPAAIETRVSDESPVAMGTSPENHSPVQNGLHDRSLPKFAFVSLLAGIFHLESPLENNRFLSQSVAGNGDRKRKRVSFNKTEIAARHLPNCRSRLAPAKHQFGHLHSTSCPNYLIEKSLPNQEFLIRGEYIDNNVPVPRSRQEFFQPPLPNSPPVTPTRQVPKLDYNVTDSPPPSLDAKGSTADSLNYHDKNNFGLRSQVHGPDSFARNPNYRPLSFQPETSDTISKVSFSKRPPVKETSLSTAPAHSDNSRIVIDCPNKGPTTASISELCSVSPQSSTNCSPKSSDSGFASQDLLEDLLQNLSSDSDSSDSETSFSETSSDTDTFVANTPCIRLPDITDQGSTSASSQPSASGQSVPAATAHLSEPTCEKKGVSLEVTVLCQRRDSGDSIDFSDDEDIPAKRDFRAKRPAPKLWFEVQVGGGAEKEQPSDEVPQKNPLVEAAVSETEDKIEKEKLLDDEEEVSYKNPFSQRSPRMGVSLKCPSVLGRLVCFSVSYVPSVSLPLQPGYFKFDTPSPDDIVRAKQRSVLSLSA